jgi:hypothetical protein
MRGVSEMSRDSIILKIMNMGQVLSILHSVSWEACVVFRVANAGGEGE